MADRPTVLYIDCSYGFGGAIKSLGLTLRHAAVDEHVLSSQPAALVSHYLPHARTGSLRRRANYHVYERLREKTRWGFARWPLNRLLALFDLAVTAVNTVRLVWLVRRRAVDILHANNGFLPLEVFLAARLTGKPVVVHLRDFPGRPFRLRKAADETVAAVIAVSDAVGDALRAVLPRPLPIVTIHDPVDMDLAGAAAPARERVRAELGLAPEHVAVGMFGRVVPWKGQAEFVRAAASAMAGDALIHAIVVGDGSDGGESYLAMVKQLAAESGFGPRFHFAGFQQHVEEYYAAMDIVVHASVYPEPFGMVVPEAMAAARPVIASAAGGPLEVIEPEVTGVLTPPADVTALARAILRLAADPGARSRLGAAAAVAARQRFSLAANAASIEAVYRDVLGRGSDEPLSEEAETRPLADVDSLGRGSP